MVDTNLFLWIKEHFFKLTKLSLIQRNFFFKRISKKCFNDSKKLFSQCCAKKIKFSFQKYVYLTHLQNSTVKCFQNNSKEESQTLSLFEMSRKNLTEAVNKLTKIDVVGIKKGKV